MQIDVHGRNLPVTEPLRAYVLKKLQRHERLFTRDCRLDVELAVERNPRIADSQVAEVTVLTRGRTLRARHAAADMYAAIDGLADRIRRQAADLHERAATGRPHHATRPEAMLGDDDAVEIAAEPA